MIVPGWVGAVDRELADRVEVRRADQGADDVEEDLGESLDDRGESAADDDGDGQVNDVALGNEVAEALQHEGGLSMITPPSGGVEVSG